jgi:hypothetical protein
MRTLDSIAAHPPIWRSNWRDDDGMLVETHLLNEIERMRLLRSADMISRIGGATWIEIVPLTESAENAE